MPHALECAEPSVVQLQGDVCDLGEGPSCSSNQHSSRISPSAQCTCLPPLPMPFECAEPSVVQPQGDVCELGEGPASCGEPGRPCAGGHGERCGAAHTRGQGSERVRPHLFHLLETAL